MELSASFAHTRNRERGGRLKLRQPAGVVEEVAVDGGEVEVGPQGRGIGQDPAFEFGPAGVVQPALVQGVDELRQ